MKKLEFLNPSLFKIYTNIEGYLDKENNSIQISGYYTSNDWINIGFYIKPTNISTTIENGNTITYLVYDLSTKKYSFTNSLVNASINKLYFKLYVYNNKFYASPEDIMPTNIISANASDSSNFAYYSLSSEFSLTSLYSLSSNVSNLAINSLSAIVSKTALYSLTSEFSLSALYALLSETSNIANISLTSNLSLTSLYSLSSGTSNFAISSLSSLYSNSAVYAYTSDFAKYALIGTDNTNKINFFSIPYTRIFVDTVYPTNVTEYDSFYNINTKRLYVYISNSWQEVNWTKYIISDKLYKEGRLRINDTTGALEVVISNTVSYEIIPTIGLTFTPISYTGYVYYIAPGQTYNGFSSSITPVLAINGMTFTGLLSFNVTANTPAWFGLYPGGLGAYPISGAYVNNITGDSVGLKGFVPVIYCYSKTIHSAEISIQLFNAVYATSIDQSSTLVCACAGQGALNPYAYYLGVWCIEGAIVTVDYVSIQREL